MCRSTTTVLVVYGPHRNTCRYIPRSRPLERTSGITKTFVKDTDLV